MVLSIYRRFSESTNFCSKERWLRPVAMMLGHVKIVNPCYFIATRGKVNYNNLISSFCCLLNLASSFFCAAPLRSIFHFILNDNTLQTIFMVMFKVFMQFTFKLFNLPMIFILYTNLFIYILKKMLIFVPS